MRLALASLAVLSAVAAWAQVPETVDPGLLPNYTVVKPALAAAGRPSEEGFRQLKAQGFRTVIDLRTASEEGQPDEKALVEALGLKYVHVPLMPASFSAADVAAVKAVLDDASSGPVLLHCQSANRVGAVWAAIRAGEGLPLEEAIEDGKRVGLRSASMIEATRRVAGGAPPAEGPKIPKP